MAEKSAVAVFMHGGNGMKAKEYLKKIQHLNFEADELMRHISILGEIAEKISCDALADILDDIVDDILEKHSSLVTKVSLMVSNITNLDEPLECAVLVYRYHRDYSWSDIAEKLHLTEKSVQEIYEKALISFEDYLEEFDDAEEE